MEKQKPTAKDMASKSGDAKKPTAIKVDPKPGKPGGPTKG